MVWAGKEGKPRKGGKPKKEASYYKDTVLLPQTAFNLRANSVVREPEIQKLWEEMDVYNSLLKDSKGDPFTLHDGPPYANGDLHIGHALNKILKDFINRFQMLQGRRVRYRPGWDCHGLPIELKVLQSMSDEARAKLTPLKLRYKARDFAVKTMKSQRDQFRRYGIWGDWEDPYLTLLPEYEAKQLEVFGKMLLNGYIYRGRKPVHWSPSSGTALAEAELEYPEGHTSPSIYVAMPLASMPSGASADALAALEGAAFAIWTTTPWTIPANLAVAVNGDLKYAVVEAEGERAEGLLAKRLVVAEDLIDTLAEKWGLGLRKLAVLSGSELEGATYTHPLYGRTSPLVIGGDYITTESGTGLVHTAPGHGQEDYQVGQKYGLELLSPVDAEGCFTSEAGEQFVGKFVQGEGNDAVVEALIGAGALLLKEKYAHKYPYDWRTKKPTIFRATSQWFASVDGFRDAALSAIEGVRWIPEIGQRRITAMTEGRNDWCISRQRKWGVPIPVFYDKDTDEPFMDEKTIAHIVGLVREKGSDVWFQAEVGELLPEEYQAEAARLRKGEDTMDVWFDSGSSWAGVVEQTEGLSLPADLYLEGSDQHRGWFQSSLLTCVAATGQAPYKSVLTHGFVLDDKGYKMSKSLGNVVDPRDVIEGGKDQKKQPGLGADVLRLWVSSVDYTSDVLIGGFIISQIADAYRKLRGTLRFLVGNLHDFNPETDAVPYDQLPLTDRYILGCLSDLTADVKVAYESYQFFKVYQSMTKFAVTDLSNFYLDAAKDRLYIQGRDSLERRSCQTVMKAVLEAMAVIISPLTPHMAEDVWQALPYTHPAGSIFQAGWFQPEAAWGELPQAERDSVAALLVVRDLANKTCEAARRDSLIGANLDAEVVVHAEDPRLAAALAPFLAPNSNSVDQLKFALIVSEARLVDSASEASGAAFSLSEQLEGFEGAVTVGVGKAPGTKCTRCWNYSTLVGSDPEHPELCERCSPVIQAMGLPSPLAAAATPAAQ